MEQPGNEKLHDTCCTYSVWAIKAVYNSLIYLMTCPMRYYIWYRSLSQMAEDWHAQNSFRLDYVWVVLAQQMYRVSKAILKICRSLTCLTMMITLPCAHCPGLKMQQRSSTILTSVWCISSYVLACKYWKLCCSISLAVLAANLLISCLQSCGSCLDDAKRAALAKWLRWDVLCRPKSGMYCVQSGPQIDSEMQIWGLCTALQVQNASRWWMCQELSLSRSLSES